MILGYFSYILLMRAYAEAAGHPEDFAAIALAHNLAEFGSIRAKLVSLGDKIRGQSAGERIIGDGGELAGIAHEDDLIFSGEVDEIIQQTTGAKFGHINLPGGLMADHGSLINDEDILGILKRGFDIKIQEELTRGTIPRVILLIVTAVDAVKGIDTAM
jgi:hypothetical protein